MADAPYLIALALLEQDGRRAMPLQGKSLPQAIEADGDPGDVGRQQALELLLRIWQRSDAAPLRRAAASDSLLLVEVPLDALTEQLPQLKAQWLNGADTGALLNQLRALAGGIWSLTLERHQPLSFVRLQ
jgi:hypothetical protein